MLFAAALPGCYDYFIMLLGAFYIVKKVKPPMSEAMMAFVAYLNR